MPTPLRTALALAAAAAGAGPAAAATATYHCLPTEVRSAEIAFIVACAEPAPAEGGYPYDPVSWTRIAYFGIYKTDPSGFSVRFLDLAQTALAAGLILRLQYTEGSASKNPDGCYAGDCRRPTTVALLAPNSGVRIPYARWPSNKDYAIGASQWHYYGPFSIGTKRALVVKLTGTGNADLYVQKDVPVTSNGYVCRPAKPDSNETCNRVVDPPSDGAAFYVAVKGVAADSSYKLAVTIEPR